MLRLNGFCVVQIGNGAAQFEHAMIGPGAKVHLLYGGAHEVFASFIELTKLLYFGWSHVAITGFAISAHIPGAANGALQPCAKMSAAKLHRSTWLPVR